MWERALRDEIRARGLRVTASRLAVLAHLKAALAPLSHAEIVEALGTWDRATVFRNLNDLADAGLVHRIDVGDHTWRFEVREDEPPGHGHFTCVSCGELTCLDGVEVVATGPVPDDVLRAAEVHLRGTCAACSVAC